MPVKGLGGTRLNIMKDSCVNSDFAIIMAGEERENGTVSWVFGKLLYTGRYKEHFSLPLFPFPAAYVKTGHADELMSSQEGFPSM